MRPSIPFLASLLVLGLTLSGCLGGGSGDDEDNDKASEPTVVDFLSLQVQTEPAVDGMWFEPGDTLNVEAVAPDNAVGNVTYAWAHQPDAYSDNFSADTLTTGEVPPGGSAEVTFGRAGFYAAGHCGPHPWMTHSVAVLPGYESPGPVTVYMLEGDIADQDSYRFSPQHVTVGVGETVTYVNIGAVMHTAEISHAGEAVPEPALLPLDGASGAVTLEGSSWRNLLVFAVDEAGNTGFGTLDVYVRDRFPDYNQTNEGTFNTFTEDPVTFPHTFDWTADITVEVTVEDPTEALQKIDVQLALKGNEDNPVIDEAATGSDTFTTRVTTAIPREYVLTVAPNQGAATTFSIRVTAVYDHTPPPRGDELPCPEPHYSLGHC